MTFLDLAKSRYSVRKYKDVPVEKEKLLQVLEAGRVAPSAVNLQPCHFIVLQDEVIRQKIFETYKKSWFQQAPVIIVVCGNHKTSWHRTDGKDHCDIDIAIAVDHMTLSAVDNGLGTCWVCAFDAAKCRQVLGLPDDIEPIVLLPLGYPDDQTDVNRHDTKRKKLEEIVSWDGYENK
ncbi:MAG: nitroreductase [Desulfitibacter sp. BRH_c19]|nr:MAG: nitroreductase [Desulfitibacter sp. BRH_c19]